MDDRYIEDICIQMLLSKAITGLPKKVSAFNRKIQKVAGEKVSGCFLKPFSET